MSAILERHMAVLVTRETPSGPWVVGGTIAWNDDEPVELMEIAVRPGPWTWDQAQELLRRAGIRVSTEWTRTWSQAGMSVWSAEGVTG